MQKLLFLFSINAKVQTEMCIPYQSDKKKMPEAELETNGWQISV